MARKQRTTAEHTLPSASCSQSAAESVRRASLSEGNRKHPAGCHLFHFRSGFSMDFRRSRHRIGKPAVPDTELFWSSAGQGKSSVPRKKYPEYRHGEGNGNKGSLSKRDAWRRIPQKILCDDGWSVQIFL